MFSLGNKKMSLRIWSGEYGECCTSTILFHQKQFIQKELETTFIFFKWVLTYLNIIISSH